MQKCIIIDNTILEKFYKALDELTQQRIEQVIDKIVQINQSKGKVIVVTGSGPNIHEGVSTLIAELVKKDIVDAS